MANQLATRPPRVSSSPSTAGMPVGPGDFLKVYNASDFYTLKLTWDGKSVVVPPGKVRMATFEQVVNHLGHPGSGAAPVKGYDESGAFTHVIPPREDERARVSIKQGWDIGSSRAGGLQELVPPPDIRVYDQDDNRVWTVVEDPTGEHQAPSGGQGDQYGQADQINRLERQLQALKLQMQVNAGSADLTVPGVTGSSVDDGGLPDLDVPTDDS
jgi:hypothetical protein